MAERNISRVIKGVTLRGTYSVKDGIVTLSTTFGSKSTQVARGSKPGSLAYVLLGELFYDARSDLLPEITGAASITLRMCGWFDEVKARTEELSESLHSRGSTTARSHRDSRPRLGHGDSTSSCLLP
jgi:hypothetical protein